MLADDLLDLTFSITNTYGTIRYFKNDEEMLKQQYSNLFFEQHYVEKFLTEHVAKSQFVFDIGAHAGSHTLMYKHINPDCKVYSFEPNKHMYNLLLYNVNFNKLNNVRCWSNAVGNFVGRTFLNDHSTDGPNPFRTVEYGSNDRFNLAGLQMGQSCQRVSQISIDSMNFDCCEFMKIDVEGYEYFVIEGAKDLIEKCKPVISYEINDKRDIYNCGDVTVLLESLGYSCYNVWEDNWLAIPERKNNAIYR